MLEKIKSYTLEINEATAASREEIESFRLKFIGRNNVINDLFDEFRSVPKELKKELGPELNKLKNQAQFKLKELSNLLSSATSVSGIDVTLPGIPGTEGSIHPISQTKSRIIKIFERQGFNVEEGPEIDNDWNNFTALNFPKNHPAREMQDTYFIEKGTRDILLRTHTSNVQIRLMNKKKPPIRSIMPGRVYRNEAISARAHCFFHQVEGLAIGKNVSFRDLKNTLYHFSKEMFGKNTRIRLRPSYFPFTEPSAEIDISCFICGGSGCKICKQTGWVEIAGSGIVDPNVLENCNIDPTKYSGFAFGMGIERITMLKYQVDDLRLFSENDVRFLKQF